jgi:hypothetical protein
MTVSDDNGLEAPKLALHYFARTEIWKEGLIFIGSTTS